MGDLLRSGVTAFDRLRRDLRRPDRKVDRWQEPEDGEKSKAGPVNIRYTELRIPLHIMVREWLQDFAALFRLQFRRPQSRRRMLAAAVVIVGGTAGGAAFALRGTAAGDVPAETVRIAARATGETTPLAERFAAEAPLPKATAEKPAGSKAAAQDTGGAAEPLAGRFASEATLQEIAAPVAAAEPGQPSQTTETGKDALGAISPQPLADRDSRPSAKVAAAAGDADEPLARTAVASALEQRLAPRGDMAVPADEIRDELLTTGSILTPASSRIEPPAAEEVSEAADLLASLDSRMDETDGGKEAGAVPIPEPRPSPETEVAAADTSNETTASDGNRQDAEAAKTASARITTFVNMRTKPENGAGVVSVLGKGSTVEVIECDLWCKVRAEGKTGFVYKSFVKRQG